MSLIITYIKKYWYVGIIFILITLLFFDGCNNRKLIKEYKNQIKQSEKREQLHYENIAKYKSEIQLINKQLDSLKIRENVLLDSIKNTDIVYVRDLKEIEGMDANESTKLLTKNLNKHKNL